MIIRKGGKKNFIKIERTKMEKSNAKVLVCQKLNKKIGKKEILKNVSLEIEEGDILGFIGPNGAGKTTTIKLILGLQSITSGEVKINGYDIKTQFENMECIADSQRKSRYEKNGISINGERINFHFVTPENAGKSDLVIIATKNLQLKDVLVQIEKAIGPETTILSLLNGIQSEQELSEKFGKEKVLYGYIVNLSSCDRKPETYPKDAQR